MKGELVKKWVKIAESDLGVATLFLNKDEGYFASNICFYCQQTVEKFIWAYYISLGGAYDKTHNIKRLLTLLSAKISYDKRLDNLADCFDNHVDDEAYPVMKEFTVQEAKSAYDKALRIKEIILPEIEKQLKEL